MTSATTIRGGSLKTSGGNFSNNILVCDIADDEQQMASNYCSVHIYMSKVHTKRLYAIPLTILHARSLIYIEPASLDAIFTRRGAYR